MKNDAHISRLLAAALPAILFLSPVAEAGSDFDGDGTDDYGCYDAAGRYGQPAGSWYFMNSSAGFTTETFGYDGTVPVVGDFDGDGTDDYGCYDAAGRYGQPAGSWYFMNSSAGFTTETFGYDGTVPVAGDFDGDGTDDYGCYDAAGRYGQPAGSWYFMNSSAGFTTETFGYDGTVPVVGDFDGDGTDDYGCYDAAGRYGQPAGSWYFMNSSAGFTTETFGYDGTVPVAGDFDGDGTDDYGCYDAAGRYGQPAGSWYFMNSSAGFTTETFGYDGTVPVVGDFDGDGTDDYGCYDAAGRYGQPAGSWYFMNSSAGFTTETFGYDGTVPVMTSYETDDSDAPAEPTTYEGRVAYYKALYGKTDAWQNWMIANRSRYLCTFNASLNRPSTVTVSFRYNSVPIAYDPAWASEAEHMAALKSMAEGAYFGYVFSFVFNGNTSSSYANAIAGIPSQPSYAYGKDVYLYYETIFNHEFAHVMCVPHHYDTSAQAGDGLHMPPGDSRCIMDRTSSLFCSGCRTALGIPLNVTDTTAVDAAMSNIITRYP